jgi:hypothetical protein
MKENQHLTLFKPLLILLFLFFFTTTSAQGPPSTTNLPNNFWRNVQFGGGIGLGFSSGYTDVTISPSAIYNVNSLVAVGVSLQFGFISAKNDYTSTLYGGSILGLVNPIPEIQLSAELEEINVNTEYQLYGGNSSDSLWNTALYLGAGYRTGNVTIGVRYDVLFNDNNGYYSDPFMPFVRVYF